MDKASQEFWKEAIQEHTAAISNPTDIGGDGDNEQRRQLTARTKRNSLSQQHTRGPSASTDPECLDHAFQNAVLWIRDSDLVWVREIVLE